MRHHISINTKLLTHFNYIIVARAPLKVNVVIFLRFKFYYYKFQIFKQKINKWISYSEIRHHLHQPSK